MKPDPIPGDEAARLRALERYGILDTESELTFDRVTRLASAIVGTPVALVSLIDKDRQWFKSRVGLDARETPRDISFCGHAVADKSTLIVENALEDARFADNPLVIGEPDIRFYAGIPLETPDGHALGTLCVIDSKPRKLDEDKLRALHDLADIVVRELELRRIALTDPLTGAMNRRMLETVVTKEMKRATRRNRPFSFALLDLDHFKKVNDAHGHDAGDAVLVAFTKIAQSCLREEDFFFRIGGEEFGSLFPETPTDTALVALERIRRSVAEEPFVHGVTSIAVTVSIGLTQQEEGEIDFEDILKRADEALYRAKDMGRNRIERE